MKEELIKQTLDKFVEDKELITQNLLKVTDYISLQGKNDYGNITIEVTYRRN